ncbi:CbiX/SirB N-terminal domain-containing protein [Paraburkholderia sp. D15]|uniref:sirohydrochlorin chelatase n=1 Tax=Paraburkholderia sp. D15 TaxID=2880218 RepID=UPI002479F324|nr:CbiX/SirB N-terminal domain-containing protein [Paraburkholderia sp. D15]WGS50677.1 CbiX/SirB N-terminal domain-containing protein [Paraburkholderia sp. D15]
MATRGIVLFAHGARDVRWREPFDRLAGKLQALRAAAGEAGPVVVAFLELMEPGLVEAVRVLASGGCDAVTVVPVFFGQGGHVRKDLPALVEECRGLFPSVSVRCAGAVGEDDGVLDAVAMYCLRQG